MVKVIYGSKKREGDPDDSVEVSFFYGRAFGREKKRIKNRKIKQCKYRNALQGD